uniref:Putative orotidine 5'-phosphate decarboxylase-like n=1 Tax=Solanum chacoense TaxID=4108 RepID=A0A0V0HW99_SOLCH
MLGLQNPHAISSCQSFLDTSVLHEVIPCKSKNVNPLISNLSSATLVSSPAKGVSSCSFSWTWPSQLKTYKLSQQSASYRLLCQSQDTTSPENEYRSSRNIAISLFRRYKNFLERGGGDNLKEFISAGVNAYALGCTDEGLRKELFSLKESGVEIEAMETYGGSTSLKSKILSVEVDECIMWLSIIFITILCTPQPTIVRWSSTSPVSDEMIVQWKGFCAIIANAYFVRGMAWLPVKTLQLEQMAVAGHAEEPSVVASRMRLVFTTLEVVSPQWPRG